MEPDAEVTRTSFRLMTPECASPEQVRGDAITTATDVYALGVLLYQLLTGEKPYEFRTGAEEEIRRTVCETEPRRPSSVRAVSDDLDNIVLKAMHKDPSRRYASVEQLSEDILRYVAGQPVIARKDTFRYRASKFLARHKTGSVATALVACSLVAGMGAILAELHVARMERARAERRFNDVRQLANSLIFELHDGVRKLSGSTSLRKLIVDRAVTYLDSLAQEVGNDYGLRRELANAYLRLGQVQGEQGSSNLGKTPPQTGGCSPRATVGSEDPAATRPYFSTKFGIMTVPGSGFCLMPRAHNSLHFQCFAFFDSTGSDAGF